MGTTVDGPVDPAHRQPLRRRPATYIADPALVGNRECDTLVSYYRRQWIRFLVNSFGMVRAAFGMDRRRSLRGAWWVLLANKAWAPADGNDPARAERLMTRFYRLVSDSHDNRFDPARAAELELVWWTEHRRAQRAGVASDPTARAALAAVYQHVFEAQPELIQRAAELRVEAFDYSDRWTATLPLDPDSHLVRTERDYLVRSYEALREAIASTPL